MNDYVINELIQQYESIIEIHKVFIKNLKKLKTNDANKENPQKRFEKVKWNNQREVVCIDTNKVYRSVREAARDTGCAASSIISCCKGRSTHVKNFHWKYVEENESKRGVQLQNVKCVETGKIYRNVFDCGKEFEVSPSVIVRACRDGEECKTYHFEYCS